MRLKIRCDGESSKFLKFWVEVNKAVYPKNQKPKFFKISRNLVAYA